MKKYNWPNGKVMTVPCPNCATILEVQISNVRDWDEPSRPDECMECGCEFEITHEGKVTILFAPPKKSTDKGRIVAKRVVTFDPKF